MKSEKNSKFFSDFKFELKPGLGFAIFAFAKLKPPEYTERKPKGSK